MEKELTRLREGKSNTVKNSLRNTCAVIFPDSIELFQIPILFTLAVLLLFVAFLIAFTGAVLVVYGASFVMFAKIMLPIVWQHLSRLF